MNYIALTGSDMHAMAQAAEILLELVTVQQLQVAIALYVNNLSTATVVKERAGPHGIGQLWRIGDDTAHPRLDGLVDVLVRGIDLEGELSLGLQQFRQRLLAHQTFTHHQLANQLEKTP